MEEEEDLPYQELGGHEGGRKGVIGMEGGRGVQLGYKVNKNKRNTKKY